MCTCYTVRKCIADWGEDKVSEIGKKRKRESNGETEKRKEGPGGRK